MEQGHWEKRLITLLIFQIEQDKNIGKYYLWHKPGYGNSPYQSCSAFSGNPYLIDFDLLTEDGLLTKKDYAKVDFGKDKTSVDYGKIFENKLAVLKKAYKNSIGKLDKEIQEFKNEQHHWIYDYALFMAIKTKFNNIPLKDWDDSIRRRDYNTLEYYRNELKDDIDFWTFLQYEFFKQWKNLKAYANSKKIEIIGDIPIYVAEDSVDVWTNPQDFFLDSDLHPSVVSGWSTRCILKNWTALGKSNIQLATSQKYRIWAGGKRE